MKAISIKACLLSMKIIKFNLNICQAGVEYHREHKRSELTNTEGASRAIHQVLANFSEESQNTAIELQKFIQPRFRFGTLAEYVYMHEL